MQIRQAGVKVVPAIHAANAFQHAAAHKCTAKLLEILHRQAQPFGGLAHGNKRAGLPLLCNVYYETERIAPTS